MGGAAALTVVFLHIFNKTFPLKGVKGVSRPLHSAVYMRENKSRLVASMLQNCVPTGTFVVGVHSDKET